MTSPRVSVKPAVYRWAFERNDLSLEEAAARFPHLPAWIGGDAKPTLKQLEAFAKAMHAPIGAFFDDGPPAEPLPIQDFRTMGSKAVPRPSPNLLDTIHACQVRQAWYQEFAAEEQEEPLDFVGSARLTSAPVAVAAEMRKRLAFDLPARREMTTWTDALRDFVAGADRIGVLVMCSGIVGSDTHRKLDPEEFRGFALADALAPLVFINGADTRSGQMFTLAHELAHIWLGASGVSDSEPVSAPGDEAHDGTEQWCNAVAAELLVPMEEFRQELDLEEASVGEEMKRLARVFKVSTLVILRRMHDAGELPEWAMWDEYRAELARLRSMPRGSGGDFYRTTTARVGRRFARALIGSTWEGRASFSEAFQLLGVRKMATFRGLSETLGMAI